MMKLRRNHEVGATALIIVMFFTLLLTVLAVGFTRLMVQEQQASQDNELSQGAYDSALAGAEDGKRVLKLCQNGDTTACAAIDKKECSTVSDAGLVSGTGAETPIVSVESSSSASASYSQAYTCVIVSQDTKDILGSLAKDGSVIELLDTNGKPFNKIVLSWFKRKNSTSDTVTFTGNQFVPLSSWGDTTPPVIRANLIQFDSNNISYSSFDGENSRTLYFIPQRAGGSADFNTDVRRTGSAQLVQPAACNSSFIGNNGFACQISMIFPGSNNLKRYLRLTALYNKADFAIQLFNGSEPVLLHGVQPSIDSTGRAADVYRRVVQRVESNDPVASDLLYPRATVDTSRSFCKDMILTTDTKDFKNNCTDTVAP